MNARTQRCTIIVRSLSALLGCCVVISPVSCSDQPYAHHVHRSDPNAAMFDIQGTVADPRGSPLDGVDLTVEYTRRTPGTASPIVEQEHVPVSGTFTVRKYDVMRVSLTFAKPGYVAERLEYTATQSSERHIHAKDVRVTLKPQG